MDFKKKIQSLTWRFFKKIIIRRNGPRRFSKKIENCPTLEGTLRTVLVTNGGLVHHQKTFDSDYLKSQNQTIASSSYFKSLKGLMTFMTDQEPTIVRRLFDSFTFLRTVVMNLKNHGFGANFNACPRLVFTLLRL